MKNKHKILVIDDEPEITDIVKAFLANAGYEVIVENSPVNAVEKAKKSKPNLVLLDIMMPFMDGYEVCAALKKEPDTTDIPVLFLTGKDANDDGGRVFESGGDLFVKKPFSCERLLQMVKMVLMSVAK
ncbi:MAG: response regulator [Candidatus Zixiibacteriota bacterium]|nr:MAG: response regulator [candidate division Zixibacteria bacterium]